MALRPAWAWVRGDDRPARAALLRSLPWPEKSIALVVEALDVGCEAKRTAGNHVLLKNDLGQTALVSSGGNEKGSETYQNNRSHVRKLIVNQPAQNAPEALPPPESNGSGNHTPADLQKAAAEQLSAFLCKLCKPPRQLLNQQALDDHRASEHVQCDWVDPETGAVCGQWLKSGRAKGPHRATAHLGVKPWEFKPGGAQYKGEKPADAQPATEDAPTPPPPEPPTLQRQGVQTRGRWYCINGRHTGRGCATNGATTKRVEKDEGTAQHDWAWRGTGPAPTITRLAPVPGTRPTVDTHLGESTDARLDDLPRAPIPHSNSRPVVNTELPDVPDDSAATILRKVRDALGEDPLITAQRKEIERLRIHVGELETRIELMRDGIRRANEASLL